VWVILRRLIPDALELVATNADHWHPDFVMKLWKAFHPRLASVPNRQEFIMLARETEPCGSVRLTRSLKHPPTRFPEQFEPAWDWSPGHRMEAELKLQRRPRMRSIMARTPFERCGGRCCSRPSARKAPRLPRPNGRERWPRYLARLVDHLRSFSPLARSLDRLGVFVISGVAKWPSAFPRTCLRRLGLPALL
jgi:hypothetical protein